MTTAPSAELLRALAQRIDAAPAVARRSSGLFGAAAAYLPGERIEGIRLRDDNGLEVHVVMRWNSTVDEVERQVLDAIGDACEHQQVTLVIDDIVAPTDPAERVACP
jgi:hypothetical protein